jgi:hypothetical protein
MHSSRSLPHRIAAAPLRCRALPQRSTFRTECASPYHPPSSGWRPVQEAPPRGTDIAALRPASGGRTRGYLTGAARRAWRSSGRAAFSAGGRSSAGRSGGGGGGRRRQAQSPILAAPSPARQCTARPHGCQSSQTVLVRGWPAGPARRAAYAPPGEQSTRRAPWPSVGNVLAPGRPGRAPGRVGVGHARGPSGGELPAS